MATVTGRIAELLDPRRALLYGGQREYACALLDEGLALVDGLAHVGCQRAEGFGDESDDHLRPASDRS